MIAASATPSWLPMPPSTTIARMIADSMKVKLSGLMKPWRVAKNTPAKPANSAPIAKAESLMFVGLMPSARQAISSSRKRFPGAADRQPAQRRVKKLVEQRERQDDEVEEDDPLHRLKVDAEELCEGRAAARRACGERQAEEGRARDAGDAVRPAGEATAS